MPVIWTSKNGVLVHLRKIITKVSQIIPVQVRCNGANEAHFKHPQSVHCVRSYMTTFIITFSFARQNSDTSIASETVDLTNYEVDDFDEEPPDCCRNRYDKESQAFVRRVVDSTFFNVFLTTTIMINIVFLIVEVIIPDNQNTSESSIQTFFAKFEMDMMDVRVYLKRMDGIFLSVYLLEFLLKFYVNPVEYWRAWSNRLDFIILVFSFAQVIIVEMDQGGGATSSDNGSDTSVSSMRILRTSTNVKSKYASGELYSLPIQSSKHYALFAPYEHSNHSHWCAAHRSFLAPFSGRSASQLLTWQASCSASSFS